MCGLLKETTAETLTLLQTEGESALKGNASMLRGLVKRINSDCKHTTQAVAYSGGSVTLQITAHPPVSSACHEEHYDFSHPLSWYGS